VLRMKYRKRIYYSESQKSLMWERWRQGATLRKRRPEAVLTVRS
jgi:hypothetical protein